MFFAGVLARIRGRLAPTVAVDLRKLVDENSAEPQQEEEAQDVRRRGKEDP